MRTIPTVTITGADESVDPEDLVKIADDYPFVEFGILLSQSRAGQPRYPDFEWQNHLAAVQRQHFTLQLSAHLCGSLKGRILTEQAFYNIYIGRFKPQRIQVNGWRNTTVEEIPNLLPDLFQHELILQARSIDALLVCHADANLLMSLSPTTGVSVLYDASGGRGQEPSAWPEAMELDHRVTPGFAGGLRPETVQHHLNAIEPALTRHDGSSHPSFWIDVESGVRTDDKFDVEKVRQFLQNVEDWCAEEEPTTCFACQKSDSPIWGVAGRHPHYYWICEACHDEPVGERPFP